MKNRNERIIEKLQKKLKEKDDKIYQLEGLATFYKSHNQ